MASALTAQFVFFGEKCLKNVSYKKNFQTKVVINQKLHLLCNVTFFDILHHFGVIAASQICTKLGGGLKPDVVCRESIVPSSYGTDFFYGNKGNCIE